jgi:hypothetical protein
MMTERLLQFLWKFQYFNKESLTTEAGDVLSIIKQGAHNFNQGPDFLEAIIKLNKTKWVGNVELHVKSSDWVKHNHATDNNYSNIILHVVWQHDTDVKDIHGNLLAVLELQNRVPKVLLERYLRLHVSPIIACQHAALPALNDLAWIAWKERLLAERLERKAEKILAYYEQSNNHWEEVFWWMLAANFGMKVNAEPFQQIAQTVQVKTLAKHKNQIHQLEALLLGQAGLLEGEFEEDYPVLLQKEYQFLKKKYKLTSISNNTFNLRMRPANFPTVRLAQLAMLIHSSKHLFSTIKELNDVQAVEKLFDITANDYWNTHYVFDKPSSPSEKRIGVEMVHNIVINTIVPVLFAYGLLHNEESYKTKSIQWLMQTMYENNTIIQQWKALGHKSKTAFDSQAFIELTNSYCNTKRCLECAVGVKVLSEN